MSLLGSKSSSNKLLRKRPQTEKETNTTFSTTDIQSVFLHPGISANQGHALNHHYVK